MLNNEQELIKAISNGMVAVVLGTGCTISSTGRSDLTWQKFILSGIDYCGENALVGGFKEWKERLTQDLHSGDIDDLFSVVDRVVKKMGGQEGSNFKRWIAKAFDGISAKNNEIYEIINSWNCPILTTNYDFLVESATGRKPLNWNNSDQLEKFLREPLSGILHIHGTLDDHRSIVLTDEMYAKRNLDDLSDLVLRSLRLKGSTVYIGFGSGLSDPTFNRHFDWISNKLTESVTRDFILSLPGDSSEYKSIKDKVAVSIPYGKTHDDLVPFLRSLNVANAPEVYSASSQKINRKTSRIPGKALQNPLRKPELFIGREGALSDLENDKLNIIGISGMGGLGKSTLAAKFLYDTVDKGLFDYWEWFDCRESDNVAIEQIIQLLRGLKNNFELYSNSSELGSLTAKFLAREVISSVGDRKLLLILDNIDNYIDIETSHLTSPYKELIEEVGRLDSGIKILLTARMPITFEDVGAITLKMEGLDREESELLFKEFGFKADNEAEKLAIRRYHEMTAGHPPMALG